MPRLFRKFRPARFAGRLVAEAMASYDPADGWAEVTPNAPIQPTPAASKPDE